MVSFDGRPIDRPCRRSANGPAFRDILAPHSRLVREHRSRLAPELIFARSSTFSRSSAIEAPFASLEPFLPTSRIASIISVRPCVDRQQHLDRPRCRETIKCTRVRARSDLVDRFTRERPFKNISASPMKCIFAKLICMYALSCSRLGRTWVPVTKCRSSVKCPRCQWISRSCKPTCSVIRAVPPALRQ